MPAAVTRTGVLRYRDGAGREWGEYRPPEEVFAADSLATLRAAPVTDGHPRRWSAPTLDALACGHVDGAPVREGSLVVVDLAVQDAALAGLVESGERREVSCGYDCDVDPTPASPRGRAVRRGAAGHPIQPRRARAARWGRRQVRCAWTAQP